MHRLIFLLSAALFLTVTVAMDGILVTTISVHADKQQWNKDYCGAKTVLELEGKPGTPMCSSDGTSLFLTYNGSTPITGKENITILLTANVKDFNGTTSLPEVVANFTGVFVAGITTDNELAQTVVTLQREFPSITTTTVKPGDPIPAPITYITEAHLTIDYIHLKYDENSKKEKTSSNGGAVAVAIIEGIALIAILSYFGYKTMVDHKRKQTANLYGYDNNNSRITVPDNIRMSDIPPPRSPVYTTPATPSTSQPPRTQPMTSQELVVPSTTTTTTTTTTTNPQFSDPFDSLDAW